MNRVAFLGLGAMGARMARNLLRAGYQLAVFNRTYDKTHPLCSDGAQVFKSAREAVGASDIVISMVTDDQASREVWFDEREGALRGIETGKVCIEMSTLTRAWVCELAGAVRAAGGGFIDAPVVGSRPQADSGQLVILAGGNGQDVQHVEHVFAAMAATTHHLGPVGAGSTAKLAVNFLFATQVAAVAELLMLVRHNGMDDATIINLLAALPVTSPAALGTLRLMATANYAPMFPIDLVIKDLGYFAQLAIGAGAGAPVTKAVRNMYAKASASGFGGDNIHGVVQAYAAESS